MATKKAFVAKHGLNVGSSVVFGSNGKLHANNTISTGTITDAMLAGSTGSNLTKVQEVESNLLATNTAIRSLVSSNDTDISSLWSSITSTNTAVRSYTDTAVANLVDTAPAALDTLNELAAALGDDANYATTMTTNLGQKLGGTATVALTGDITASATAFSANAVSITTSLASDLRSSVSYIGLDSGDYIGWSDNTHTSFFVNAGERVRIEADGDIHADGDMIAYSTTISDRRLKDNIQTIEGAVDKVKQLTGCTFTYTADGKESAGLIAQDVEKVLPSAVTEKELPLKKDDGIAYKTVQYDQTIGLLVEAIKEQQVQIDELKSKLK